MKKDIYEIITERILEQLKEGTIPWRKPWTGGHSGAYNYTTGKAYSLLNQILLKHDDAYLTFNQVKTLGGKVKKGAKSEIVTFWKQLPIEVEDKDGNKVKKNIPFLRYYTVFWIGDTEGIERKEAKRVILDPVQEAENFVEGYMNSANHPTLTRDKLSNRAYYSPVMDCVVVPTIEQFKSIAEYYSTLFHELTHSTGHASRLNRLTETAHFGSEEYSKEELVAEIGAATLVNMAGIETNASFKNSAAYIEGWSRALRENKKMIVEASSKAGKAVNYILGINTTSPDTDPDKGPETVEDTEATPASEPETVQDPAPAATSDQVQDPAPVKKERKSNEQKAFDQLVKWATRDKSPIKSGIFDGIAYASEGHQVMRTTEAIEGEALDDLTANTYASFMKTELNATGNIYLTAKDCKEGIKAAKNGRRGAKVVYVTAEGIVLNADFLYNALLATGSTSYRYDSKKAKKQPVMLENDTTAYMILPINSVVDLSEGFQVIG